MNENFEEMKNAELNEGVSISENEALNDVVEEISVEEMKNKKKKGWKSELLDWIESLGIAIIAALLIVNFVCTFVRVSGESMEPTLQNNNSLFVFRLGYQPKNGDIIVFKPVGDPKKYYIKRVIATEGQEIDIRDGKVYVDGKELEEDYIQGVTFDRYGEVYPKIVPEDSVFAMGDNRENSSDSRNMTVVGMIKNKSIVGKALFRVFPFDKIGGLYN